MADSEIGDFTNPVKGFDMIIVRPQTKGRYDLRVARSPSKIIYKKWKKKATDLNLFEKKPKLERIKRMLKPLEEDD